MKRKVPGKVVGQLERSAGSSNEAISGLAVAEPAAGPSLSGDFTPCGALINFVSTLSSQCPSGVGKEKGKIQKKNDSPGSGAVQTLVLGPVGTTTCTPETRHVTVALFSSVGVLYST